MHIKEVAKRLNTTSRAIRFYEEKGLITPKKDTENDYRSFTDSDIVRLSTILTMREIGVTVNDIGKILSNPELGRKEYLNIQRSVLFEKWIEMKDMIETIDEMMERTTYTNEELFELAQHLKGMKNARKNWHDKWNFDNQAADYDQNIKMHGYRFNVHQDYEKALSMVTEKVDVQPEHVCVDIGVGTGNLGAKFLTKKCKVIGIDQSEKMLQMCEEKHPAIETRKGHFLALPILDNQVNSVVSSYALHHLPDEEKLLALKEMDRVLKQGGQICIVDLMFLNEENRKIVIENFRKNGNTEAIAAIEDEFYANRSLLTDWLTRNGYRVETHHFNDILSLVYARKEVVM